MSTSPAPSASASAAAFSMPLYSVNGQLIYQVPGSNPPQYAIATPQLYTTPPDSPSTSEQKTIKRRWSDREIKQLLQKRLDMKEKFNEAGPHAKKHKYWDRLCLAIGKDDNKWDRNAEQCQGKFDSLIKEHKKVVDNNNKSGNERQDWQWLDRMDHIFSDKVNIVPLHNYDSLVLSVSPLVSHVTNAAVAANLFAAASSDSTTASSSTFQKLDVISSISASSSSATVAPAVTNSSNLQAASASTSAQSVANNTPSTTKKRPRSETADQRRQKAREADDKIISCVERCFNMLKAESDKDRTLFERAIEQLINKQ